MSEKGWPRSTSPKMEAKTNKMLEASKKARKEENIKTMSDANVYNDIVEELKRARSKHPVPFHSSHEGYAILLEEVDELWQEVKKQTEERSYALMRKEAIQIAAMAIRFTEDVCNPRMVALLQKRLPTEGEPSQQDGKKEEGKTKDS